MTTLEMVRELKTIRLNGDAVAATFRRRTDETVDALRRVKPGIRFLAECAERAECDEPLLTLVREFCADLDDFTAGAWTEAPVVDAIQTIGFIDGWRFRREAA